MDLGHGNDDVALEGLDTMTTSPEVLAKHKACNKKKKKDMAAMYVSSAGARLDHRNPNGSFTIIEVT